MTTMTCQSCGRETTDDETVAVRRAYFLDAEDPDPRIDDDVENWCASCRFTYPHVEENGPASGA